MKTLKKGDPCRVRLHTGEVVEAVYGNPRLCSKEHWLLINNPTRFVHAGRELKRETRFDFEKVRFVANPCDHLPMEVRA